MVTKRWAIKNVNFSNSQLSTDQYWNIICSSKPFKHKWKISHLFSSNFCYWSFHKIKISRNDYSKHCEYIINVKKVKTNLFNALKIARGGIIMLKGNVAEDLYSHTKQKICRNILHTALCKSNTNNFNEFPSFLRHLLF